MVEEFSESRISDLQYRVADDPFYRDELNRHLESMFQSQNLLEQTGDDGGYIEQLRLLKTDASAYQQSFERAYQIQIQKNSEIERLNQHVADLSRELAELITVLRGDFDSNTAVTAEGI